MWRFRATHARRDSEVPALLAYVGYWDETGKHLLVLSFTGFDRVEIPQCSGLPP
jgi:hypothetical protein